MVEINLKDEEDQKSKMNLFPEEIPIINTQEELDKSISKFNKYGSDFVSTASILERRDWVESMWKEYEPYAENNFRVEIQKDGMFNRKAWELYMHAFLHSKGIPLQRRNGEGPDFLINLGKNIFIEATAPSVGEVDPSPERPILKPGEIYSGGGGIEEKYRTLVLRFTTAIRNKSSKLPSSQYFKGIVNGSISESDCYIIAINGYDFCGLVHDPEFLIRRSLLGAGCMAYRKLPDGTLTKGEYLSQPFVDKYKPDGTIEKIPTDVFTNETYKEVSAIIYSPEHIINAGTDINKISNRLFLIRNPFASNPLPIDFPLCGKEIVYDKGTISTLLNIIE